MKIDISYKELKMAIDFIEMHRKSMKDDFVITIENIGNEIGVTTNVSIKEWYRTPDLFTLNVTDYNNW